MVLIEDVTNAPEATEGTSAAGVPRNRRVQFSNEVSTVENTDHDGEDAGEGQAQTEVCI